MKRCFLLALAGLLFGCTTLTVVQPWERQYLSDPAMRWDVDGVEASLEKHIFFAKEASSGGDEAVGGGCGCN